MAAEVLAGSGARVILIDHMPAPARKFLLAGRGGLNLTHSEPLDAFLARYGEARGRLEPAIRAFPPEALIAWASGLGIETFVGSSGRVFPKAMKASPLLRAWLRRLDSLGVTLRSRTEWAGFEGIPTILAMGGASWPHLGSDAKWVPVLQAAGIMVHPFKPANSRFLVNWSKIFRERFAGTPVKNVALSYAGHRVRGELMISQDGIEGGAIYALSKGMREKPGHPLMIDLRPDLTVEALAGEAALGQKRGDPDLRAVVLHWLDAGPVPKVGDVVGLTVDQTYRDVLSLQHTGVHLAALALNQCAASFWTKDGQDPDTLGFPNLDQAAVTGSEIGVTASLDVYRLGKSLRKKGFDRDAFVADLSDRAAMINATLATMLASPAPVSLTPTEGQLGDRRLWSTQLGGKPVSMPCGGTHVADLSQIARITVTLEPVEDGFAMRTLSVGTARR